ncbi:Aldose reductase [Spironucleus salmonicida]|nr:Aldose reductase [Spironucleus salmonicida]
MWPPQLGYGTYKITESLSKESLKIAFDAGYRHIDCAAYYGNEAFLGIALSELFKTYNRKDFFITSKIWPTMMQNVKDQLLITLQDLQIEYLDLYLIHQPIVWDMDTQSISKKSLEQVWVEMEGCQRENLTKNIGVSNYSTKLVTELLNYCTIKPFMNQIECSLEFQNDKVIKFCIEHNIHVTGYRTLMKSQGTFDNISELKQMATKYNKTIPQIVIKWHLQKWPKNYSILVKSANKSRCQQNIDINDFALTKEEMIFLQTLDQNKRTCPGLPEWKLEMNE